LRKFYFKCAKYHKQYQLLVFWVIFAKPNHAARHSKRLVLVDLDGGVDLAHKREAAEEANCACGITN
jgi:hypothetical protein